MPLVEIHLLEGRNDTQKKALLDAVTEAVHDSIGVPLTSIRVWIQEISPKEYMSAGDLYSDRKYKPGCFSDRVDSCADIVPCCSWNCRYYF